MGLHPCGIIAKVIMAIINVVYVVVGFILIGVGIVFLAEEDELELLAGDDTVITGVAFMIAGTFVILVAVLGIVSSIWELYPLLVVYALLSTVLIALEGVAATLCYVNRGTITHNSEAKFTEYIQKYRSSDSDDYNAKINSVIDVTQSGLHCCGLHGFVDWNVQNEQYVLKYGYPSSCECNKEIDGSNCLSVPLWTDDKEIWIRGCNKSFYDIIQSNYLAIGGSGLGIAAVQLIPVILGISLCLCIMSAKSTEHRIARIQAAAYTRLESFPQDEDDPPNHAAKDQTESPYPTRTLNNELEPNDTVDTSDRRIYIQ